MDGLIEGHSTDRNWFGSYANVSLQFWRSTATIVDLEAAASSLRRTALHNDGPVVALSVLTSEGMPRMTEDARRRAIALVRESASALRISVQVIEGTGVVPTLLRAVVNGVTMFSETPSRVFATEREATRMLVERRYVRCAEDDLLAAVVTARKRWNERWHRR
jgi:hypothetical protein